MGRRPAATHSPVKTRNHPADNAGHLASTKASGARKGQSQAHPGVAALHPVTHRNTSFQPLPRPLGLGPYHYDISDHFPDIAKAIGDAGEMVFHVVGDTGGVVDGEYQNNV